MAVALHEARGDIRMIVDEAVRGHVPPPWFWALPGIDRIRAFDLSQLPSPPIARLLGIRAGHVGPGSGTWVMPATGWSSTASGELEVSMLAEAAVTGVAMTTLAPGQDVDPVSLALSYFRPIRPQAGNLLARARVVNASRLFVFVEVEIEDPHGRQVAHGTSHCEVRQVEPSPPPLPSGLRPVDEAVYSTPDPYLRAVRSRLASPEIVDEQGGLPFLRAYLQGRFVAPFSELTGCLVTAIDERRGALTMTMPATEWLCRFSRCIAPGAIASLANSASWAAGLTILSPGQSFAGLAHSTCFFQAIPADGRILRAEATATLRGRGVATADVEVYDADGQLAASAQGFAQLIDSSKRQKPVSSEVKRILATLLFTDIVGSTDHARRLGDGGWRAVLSQHHNAVRAEIQRCEGIEVDTAGDGFFARFESPARALECARAARDAVKRLGIDVRVGIHTGECELQGRALTGMAVHVAARIQALAGPGDILVSSTVKDIVVGSGTRFEDRGQHALKGTPGEWRLFSLVD
jgi:class 3 adenylate cyclase